MTPESCLKKGIKQYLRLTGWKVWSNYQTMGSVPGMSDLTALRDGVYLWIEAKIRPRKQSPTQKEFQAMIEDGGGIYLLIYDIDELIEAVGAITGERETLFAGGRV